MKLSFLSLTRFAMLPLMISAVVACSDSASIVAPPEGSEKVTGTDRDNLNETLNNEALLSAIYGDNNEDKSSGFILEVLFAHMNDIGTMEFTAPPSGAGVKTGTYKAFGGQVTLAIKAGTDAPKYHRWTGIMALNNIANPTAIILASISKENATATFPPFSDISFDESINLEESSASYIEINGTNSTVYEAKEGKITFSSLAFSSNENKCRTTGYKVLDDLQGVSLSDCKSAAGTIKGSLSFKAFEVGGPKTVTVPLTAFNLPANNIMLHANAPAED